MFNSDDNEDNDITDAIFATNAGIVIQISAVENQSELETFEAQMLDC